MMNFVTFVLGCAFFGLASINVLAAHCNAEDRPQVSMASCLMAFFWLCLSWKFLGV